MIKKFKKWLQTERVGRFEEGTSQDMCSTNGDLLVFRIIMTIVGLLIGAAILLR